MPRINNRLLTSAIFFFLSFFSTQAYTQAQKIVQADWHPPQYPHDQVLMHDFAAQPDGFWLYEPASPVPDTAPVLVFLHGYGGYNPMIYGEWIKHLVRQGNIVIYPRYQRNLMFPRPNGFAPNATKAIREALQFLINRAMPAVNTDKMIYVGHSYGGVISADIAIHYEKYKVPKPAAIMLVSPGTSWLSGGRLKSYMGMPADTKVVILTSEYDEVVGDEFAWKVFREAVHTPDRILLNQLPDHHGTPEILATHNQAYCVDQDFDSGVRNYTAKRALRITQTDAVDYYAYWRTFDALLDCVRMGERCTLALGGTEEQRSLGNWSDGQAVQPLEVTLPAPVPALLIEPGAMD